MLFTADADPYVTGKERNTERARVLASMIQPEVLDLDVIRAFTSVIARDHIRLGNIEILAGKVALFFAPGREGLVAEKKGRNAAFKRPKARREAVTVNLVLLVIWEGQNPVFREFEGSLSGFHGAGGLDFQADDAKGRRRRIGRGVKLHVIPVRRARRRANEAHRCAALRPSQGRETVGDSGFVGDSAEIGTGHTLARCGADR